MLNIYNLHESRHRCQVSQVEAFLPVPVYMMSILGLTNCINIYTKSDNDAVSAVSLLQSF